MKPDQEELWLTSKAALKALKISSCELCHLRQAGKLQFKKLGNAYLYSSRDLENIAVQKTAGSRHLYRRKAGQQVRPFHTRH